jgi:hypothetical protein
LEANPEKIESEMEHEEVPKEEASLETVRALTELYGDRHLAVRLNSSSPCYPTVCGTVAAFVIGPVVVISAPSSWNWVPKRILARKA